MSENCEILTIVEACKILRISRPTLMRLLAEGKLHGFKVGKRVWRIKSLCTGLHKLDKNDFFAMIILMKGGRDHDRKQKTEKQTAVSG